MTTYIISLDPKAEIDEVTNLLLNMGGGLEYKDLSDREKQLLKENGYLENENG